VGVLTVINANMANAIRSRTVEKGLDPRDFCLVASGGAGPLHGAEVAAILGVPEVLIPASPGICSAMGLMTTDLKYDDVRTVFARSDRLDPATLADDFAAMANDLEAQVRQDGIDPAVATYRRGADLRYLGQGYELRVDVADGPLDAGALALVVNTFHARHAAEYGHGFPDKPVEVVNVRLTASAPAEKLRTVPAPACGSLASALVRRAPCVFRTPAGLQEFDTPRYERDRLPLDLPIPGPCIVLQTDSTTVAPPGATLTAMRDGNLIIRLGTSA
jgi:N-methylhydantoinase A